MKRLILFFLLLTFISACAGNENARRNSSNQTVIAEKQSQPKPAEAVRFSAEKTEIKIGGAGEAVLNLKIEPPFHINANPPSDENLIPTSIEFESKNGLTFEKPIYPAGVMKKFKFSEKLLSVYDGEITIKLPIKIAANAGKGAQNLTGKLKFQPCDEEVCYRPQIKDITLNINVN